MARAVSRKRRIVHTLVSDKNAPVEEQTKVFLKPVTYALEQRVLSMLDQQIGMSASITHTLCKECIEGFVPGHELIDEDGEPVKFRLGKDNKIHDRVLAMFSREDRGGIALELGKTFLPIEDDSEDDEDDDGGDLSDLEKSEPQSSIQ